MSVDLVETSMVLLRNYVFATMPASLVSVRAKRTGNEVATSDITKVYLTEKPVGPQAPFVILSCPRAELVPENFVRGRLEVYASVIVEDSDKEFLVFKAWRYQSALYKTLHRLQLTATDTSVKLVVKVIDATFSPEYQDSESSNVFRREVMLKCEVEHWEKNT